MTFSETRSQQVAAKHAGYWNEAVVNIPRNEELDSILIAKTSRKLARRHSTSQIQSQTPILKEIRRLSEPKSDAVTDETQQAIYPPSAEVKAVHQLDDGSK